MKDVRAALDPEEPDYAEAASLGPDAIPHLETLVGGRDPMLASKAAYLASLIKDSRAAEIVAKAAHSGDAAVRVAAAAAASNLSATGASAVLVDLVGDEDPGVRKVARSALPGKPSAKLTKVLDTLATEPEPMRDSTPSGTTEPVVTGLMPGEESGDMPGQTHGGMPGERTGTMPGEHTKMPGES
jgi:hypothetical protein